MNRGSGFGFGAGFGFILVVFVVLLMAGLPAYNVYSSEQNGRALLAEAQ